MTPELEWQDNKDQPFSRAHPLEIYIPKETLISLIEAQIAIVERGRVPIIESEEEREFIDTLLRERHELRAWAEKYSSSHIFVQMSPRSEFFEPGDEVAGQQHTKLPPMPPSDTVS